MMKKIFLLIFLVMIAFPDSHDVGIVDIVSEGTVADYSDLAPLECFEVGNRYYKDENFAMAADLYQMALEQGIKSAEVYYNLGNAYFRSDNIAHSILAYERAFFLNPRDKDIVRNLEYANLFTHDKISSIFEGTLIGHFWKIIRLVTYRELIFFIIVVVTLAVILLFTYLISVRRTRPVLLKLSIVLFVVGLLATGLYIVKLNDSWLLNSAIVVSRSLTVQSSPTQGGEHLFTLHPGTKVVIKESYGDDFLRVAIKDGREGWLAKSGVIRVLPDRE